MTDETQIQTTPDSPSGSEESPSPEMLMQAGDALSKSLLFALERGYLDGPVFANNYVRLLPGEEAGQADLAFLEVEQVGKPVGESGAEYFRAIQTTLAACHDPRYTLVFIISSDGLRNRIYIGVNARVPDAQPKIFAEQLGQFLCSNWPGTRVRAISDYKQVVDHVHLPLSTYRYARAFTGIPSAKTSDKPGEYPQSLDRFMRGLRGKPYVYMVIANPIAERDVADIVTACHTLSGQVHAFTKSTINRSTSRGTSESVAQTDSDSTSTGTTTGTSETKGATASKGALGTTLDKSSGAGKGLRAAGLAGISALLLAAGGPFLLSGMLGMFGQLLPSSGTSDSSGTSTSDSETTSKSTGTSTSQGTTTGESLSFGQEYLNKHAEACVRLLEKTAARFETAKALGCWNVGVYMVSNQGESAAQGQAQFKALVSGEKSTSEPVRAHDLAPLWDGQIQTSLDAFRHPPLRLFAPEGSERLHHPCGEAFENLTTPLNTEELSLLANLPLREMPGMPLQLAASFSLNPPRAADSGSALQIGQILEGGEEIGDLNYEVDLDTLTRHVFITGITGSGKSNTCRRLLASLMESGRNFLVIEPAKDEYVQLALAYNQAKTFDRGIAVYLPGRSAWGGQPLEQLQLNPFDIIRLPGATAQVMPHLDRLKSIFNASFPMYEILPIILEEALVDLYDSQGWLEERLPPDNILCPTLGQLHDRITGLVRAKGYEQRITDNITAAMRTRIGSLMRGWKGRLFDQPASTPWADLFDRPVVINLGLMGDDADKCFTMALLMNFMYEYRQAQYERDGSPESSTLRHLAIIEEAHRILRAAHYTADNANPQAKMGEMFADILAEIRAYGQGLAIIDQVPSKLVPDALKNTNLKIVHRLVSADDRDAMAGAMALSEDQAKVIARLKVGQAIVCGIQDDTASWVKVFHTPIPRFNPQQSSKAKKET
ncbi:MAG: ATP-binding protein [Anaerolineales bacterium]|nr:ATP-binding protein [Anaerolineales bacterium]